MEEEKKELESTIAENTAGSNSNQLVDRNSSADELDSDDLDGNLDLSDDEENGGAIRQEQRQRAAGGGGAGERAGQYAVEFDTNIFKVSLACLEHRG